jgi:nitroreductase
MNAIFTRRSVRNFLEKDVEMEKIDKLLRAAMQAPSAANQQPWEFLVVTGKENLIALSQCSPYAASLKNAKVGIVVLANQERLMFKDYWQQDLGAATQNILLEATELELGTVWYGTAPDQERMKYIQNLYDLQENLVPFSVIAIGYPKKEDANSFVDRYDEKRVHYIK